MSTKLSAITEPNRNFTLIGKQAPSATPVMNAEWHFQQGMNAETIVDLYSAEEHYTATLKLNPNHIEALVNLAAIKLNQWKDKSDLRSAERIYLKVTQMQPSNILAHYNLAVCYDEQRKPRKALENYEKTLLICRTHADAHYKAAKCAESLKRYSRSWNHYRLYLKYQKSKDFDSIAYAKRKMRAMAHRLRSHRLRIKMRLVRKEPESATAVLFLP